MLDLNMNSLYWEMLPKNKMLLKALNLLRNNVLVPPGKTITFLLQQWNIFSQFSNVVITGGVQVKINVRINIDMHGKHKYKTMG